MSLVNKMLQDLESRRATLAGDAGISHDVRSLPPQRTALPWAEILGGALTVLLVGAAIWWFLEKGPAGNAPAPAVAVPIVAASLPLPVAPAPVVAPEAAPAVVPPTAPAPVEAPTPPAPAQVLRSTSPAQAAAKGPQAAVAPAADRKVSARPPAAAAPVRAKAAQEARTPTRQDKPAPRKSERSDTKAKVVTAVGEASPGEETAADDSARIKKNVRVSTPRDRAENDYRQALGLVNQGRIQDAVAVLRGTLKENPEHAASRLALFGLLIEQQRFDDAQALLEETLARDPAQPQMASRLARLKLARGDTRGAEETLNRAAGAALKDPEYRALHAAVLQRLELHKKAVAEYQAALRLFPQSGVWWMGMGISLEADGSLPEARDAFQRARATGALSPELTAFVEQRLKRLQ